MYMSGFKMLPRGSSTPCIVFLFSNWKINSDAKLVVSVVGSLLLGMSNSLLFDARRRLHSYEKACACQDDSSKRTPVGPFANGTFLGAKFFLVFSQLAVAYVLMLIAMTYVGIYFIAVVLGLTVGHVLSSARNIGAFSAELEPCCRDPFIETNDLERGEDDAGFSYGRLATAGEKETTLLVKGMTCKSCVKTVRSALLSVRGVRCVDVTLVVGGTSTVRVAGDAVSPSAAVGAVENCGFDASAGPDDRASEGK